MPPMHLCATSPLPDTVERPDYTPEQHGVGIVHLGVGAFHRAHQAVYTDTVLGTQGGDWRILGVSLRNPDMRDRLAPQDYRYSVIERSAEETKLRVIGAVSSVLVAPENPGAVLDALSDPAIRIVSLTITEKGYLRDPATGSLKQDDPDIAHDLANPAAPRSMHGFVVEALHRRQAQGIAPFTLMSCDNLPENGAALRQVVVGFAELRDPALAAWIANTVPFPCTMVDRIVPAMTDDDLVTAADILGVEDAAPVSCEGFSQWVIEDKFCAGRPAWETAGVELVDDVAPYEEMKLRLLNGTHSPMAYLGYLAGYDYIHQTIADDGFRGFVRALMDQEITPTLTIPPGTDITAYKDQLIERYRNPSLRHRTWQIAMDGTQKLPQRLLNTIRDRIAADAPYPRLALAVAAWMRYVTGRDEAGGDIDVRDPMAARLRQIADLHQDSLDRYADTLMSVTEVFGSDLSANDAFRGEILTALKRLYAVGAQQAVASLS